MKGGLPMRRAILVLVIASCLGLAATAAIAQSETVGSVSQLKGTAPARKVRQSRLSISSLAVLMNEELATGKASRLAVSFLDEPQLTFGEKAKVRVDRFVYSGSV
jgi:hypothetical protein